MPSIHVLDKIIADQIAAGEVIDRPVSVVKELLENALDAGATSVQIDIIDGGMGLIRVSDNGSGMEKEDLPLAFLRNATSKITHFNDLFQLHSFGFRGEALASMAAVAQVRAISGKSAETPAWQYDADRLQGEDLQAVSPRQGTIIEVRNLFYNVPARKKFVRSNTHEFGLIEQLVSVHCLAYPTVSFQLTHQRKPVLQTTNLQTVEERMAYLYGDIQGHLLHVPRTAFSAKHFVEVYMTDATITRNTRQDMIFFVNGRLVKSKELQAIVDEAYYSYVPKGRFPICFMRLDIPAENLDVNVHPAKTTVKMVHLDRWRAELVDLLQDRLWQSRLSVTFDRLPEPLETTASDTVTTPELPKAIQPSLAFREPAETSVTTPSRLIQEPSESYTGPLFTPPQVPEVTKTRAEIPSPAPPTTVTKQELSDLELIGQLNHTFILAQSTHALYVIDQHTCHERILYEKYMKAETAKEVVVQKFLLSVPLHLTPSQEAVLVEHIVLLRDLGVVVANTDDRRYELLGLPMALEEIHEYDVFVYDLLDTIAQKPHLTLADVREDIVITASCKAAVKAHHRLTIDEMLYLLEALQQTDNAHTCPHGRPIIMEITMNDLYRFFKRGSYSN